MSMHGFKIKVNKDELLQTLVDNRETHRKNFSKAVKKYKEECRHALSKKLDLVASAPNDEDCTLSEVKSWTTFKNLICPLSFERDYTEAIDMLSKHTGDSVQLDQNQFSMLVKDEWSWKDQYRVTTMSKLR